MTVHEVRVAPDLRAGSGAIVNCSSLGGLPGRGASKHGVLGLTKSAALKYVYQGIRINAVRPDIIDTPMVAGMKETESEAVDILEEQVPARCPGSGKTRRRGIAARPRRQVRALLTRTLRAHL